MAIDTTFVTVCGQLRTRKLHAKYSAPPSTPATMFQGYIFSDINVYMQRKQTVPAHCSMLFNILSSPFHPLAFPAL